jgi:hypothetical protein
MKQGAAARILYGPADWESIKKTPAFKQPEFKPYLKDWLLFVRLALINLHDYGTDDKNYHKHHIPSDEFVDSLPSAVVPGVMQT